MTFQASGGCSTLALLEIILVVFEATHMATLLVFQIAISP